MIDIDSETDSIEIQFYDGDVVELDFGAWGDSLFNSIEAPEDARAPFDDVESDDLGYTDTAFISPAIAHWTICWTSGKPSEPKPGA